MDFGKLQSQMYTVFNCTWVSAFFCLHHFDRSELVDMKRAKDIITDHRYKYPKNINLVNNKISAK